MAENKLKTIQTALADAFYKLIHPNNMRKYGEQAAEMIQRRTQLGYGVDKDGADKKPLKKLSPSYIEQRKQQNKTAQKLTFKTIKANRGVSEAKYQRKNQKKRFNLMAFEMGGLSPLTSPAKSNLTRTGQMLDSQGVTHVEEGEVIVGPHGLRGDGKTNEEVAAYVTYAGRPFNNLSKIEVKRVNDAIRKDLKKILSQKLTGKPK